MPTGTAIIDFGAAPGNNEASVVVTGQAAILADSYIEASAMMTDTTADHPANDHKYLPLFLHATCGDIIVATSFKINAVSEHKLTGLWSLRWVYP